MRKASFAFLSGALFALGLLLSGMTKPSKVIGFLDFFGNWDASLMFVMMGAILVHFALLRMASKRNPALLACITPQNNKIDRSLVLGTLLFGIGWGIAGYCPGPALVSAASFSPRALLFVSCMFLGILLEALTKRVFNTKTSETETQDETCAEASSTQF